MDEETLEIAVEMKARIKKEIVKNPDKSPHRVVEDALVGAIAALIINMGEVQGRLDLLEQKLETFNARFPTH